jgi:ankyrin repeat protein
MPSLLTKAFELLGVQTQPAAAKTTICARRIFSDGSRHGSAPGSPCYATCSNSRTNSRRGSARTTPKAATADDGFLPDEPPTSSPLLSIPSQILQKIAREHLDIGSLCDFMRASKLVCDTVLPLRLEVFLRSSVNLSLKLVMAAERGHLQIFQNVLESDEGRRRIADERASISDDFAAETVARGSTPLLAAVVQSRFEVALYLLQSPHPFLPGELDCALQIACDRGLTTVVRTLLSDHRCDPTAANYLAFLMACDRGFLEIVSLMLADGRVRATAFNNCAIQLASENGNFALAALLLRDASVDPSAEDFYSMRVACVRGHGDVVQLLLLHPLVAAEEARGTFEQYKHSTLRVSAGEKMRTRFRAWKEAHWPGRRNDSIIATGHPVTFASD